MRVPRWLLPAVLATAILVFGLVLARLPEYAGRGRTTMVFVSFIASALLGGFSALHIYIFKPRLGAATGHVLVSLVVFALATLVAWALPACPSDPSGARCTSTEAVANGFAMMLVALCFSIVVLLWHITKRSIQLLFRPFGLLLPPKVKSRFRLGQAKTAAAKASAKDTGKGRGKDKAKAKRIQGVASGGSTAVDITHTNGKQNGKQSGTRGASAATRNKK